MNEDLKSFLIRLAETCRHQPSAAITLITDYIDAEGVGKDAVEIAVNASRNRALAVV